MTAGSARVLYIHGFKSSPQSRKARSLVRYCQERFPPWTVAVPTLSFDPAEAMALLETVMREQAPDLLVGSSLGGYYATNLMAKHGARLPRLKAALINPAVSPWRTLPREFLGRHVNPYTGEEFELLPRHVEFLRTLEADVEPGRFLVLLQTGDEVLDHRLALQKYAGARMVVREGGGHAFENFDSVLPAIVAFASEDK